MVAVRRLAAVAARRRRRWALDPRCLQTSMRGVDAGEISAVSRPYLSFDLGCRSHLDRIHVGRRGPQAASRLFLGFLALDFLTSRLPPSASTSRRLYLEVSRLHLGCFSAAPVLINLEEINAQKATTTAFDLPAGDANAPTASWTCRYRFSTASRPHLRYIATAYISWRAGGRGGEGASTFTGEADTDEPWMCSPMGGCARRGCTRVPRLGSVSVGEAAAAGGSSGGSSTSLSHSGEAPRWRRRRASSRRPRRGTQE